MRAVTVSVVVPTRNRADSLDRTLAALGCQTRPPDEIIVVDASDVPADEKGLRARHPSLPISLVPAQPGVCAQRNSGVRAACGSWVLLCDDDIEVPNVYLEQLVAHVEEDCACGAVTGVLTEPDRSGNFGPGFPALSLSHLAFAFVFQTSVFGDTSTVRAGPLTRPLARAFHAWYRRRGNTWSLAGWPLVTQLGGPTPRTATYGLGAALVRRDWLMASPFDERLGPHGIGDNYGVALGFPEPGGIVILRQTTVRHHRVGANRLDEAEATYRRILALDHFMDGDPRFTLLNRVFLVWSLLGQTLLLAAKRRPSARSTARALRALLTRTNALRGATEGRPVMPRSPPPHR